MTYRHLSVILSAGDIKTDSLAEKLLFERFYYKFSSKNPKEFKFFHKNALHKTQISCIMYL